MSRSIACVGRGKRFCVDLPVELVSSAHVGQPHMKSKPTKSTSHSRRKDELRDEYDFDYSKSRPNRFAPKLKGTTAVVLQPDVAKVFKSAEAVNELLRSAIAATGAASRPKQRPKPPKGRAA